MANEDPRTWEGANTWGIPFPQDVQDALAGNPPRGVFAEHPGATPKYLSRKGPIINDFRDTMARLFVEVSKGTAEQIDRYITVAFPDTTMQALARALLGNATKASTKGGCGYVDFVLQSVNMPIQEKVDVVELLSDSYVAYYFGSAAPRWQFSGTVYNTQQDDQANALMRIYLYLLRGTQLARRNLKARMRFDDRIVVGSMNGQTLQLSGETEMAISFSFEMLVKRLIILPPIAREAYGIVPVRVPFGPEDVQSTLRRNEPQAKTTTQMTPAAQPSSAAKPGDKLVSTIQGSATEATARTQERSALPTYEPTACFTPAPAEVSTPPTRT